MNNKPPFFYFFLFHHTRIELSFDLIDRYGDLSLLCEMQCFEYNHLTTAAEERVGDVPEAESKGEIVCLCDVVDETVIQQFDEHQLKLGDKTDV
jgi:hypothetical protein